MIKGKVNIGEDHLNMIRTFYRLFGLNPFTFRELKANEIKIGNNTLGSLYRMGALERVGFRESSYYGHKWRISEKSVDTMDRRGYAE